MGSISNVVSITITKGSQSVSVQSFSVPCIFGPSARFGDPIRYYTSPTAMLSDGFLTTDPEYIFAVSVEAQSPAPPKFGVSHFTASVVQVDRIQVNTLAASHLYEFTLDSVLISYTSTGLDTQQSILVALNSAIVAAFPTNPPVTGAVTGSGPAAELTLTATVAGAGASYSAVDADLTLTNLTPNHSIAQDIAALQAVDDTWYGVLVTSHADNDIEQVASYIETQLKLYGTSSNDSDILTSVSTDLASILKGKSFERTYLMYSASPNLGPEAAWMGRMFPTVPGSANWNFKTLVEISPDNLSPTQIANAQGKNCNVYITIGGVNIATLGVTPGGEFIDVTVFLDWLKSTMQANVFSVLVNNPKVPYTNKGVVAIENPIAQTLQQGQNNGGLAAGWTVNGPDVANVSQADKADRTLNGVSFNAQLAGAINVVNIQGFVSV